MRQRPRKHPDPLVQTDQTQAAMAGGRPGLKATPIVGDAHGHASVLAGQLHSSRASLCVIDDVAQRFLRDAVEAQGDFVGHRSQLGCHVERHCDTRLRAHLFTAPPQCVHQTEMLEQGGVQLVGQRAEIVPQRDRLSLQVGQLVVYRLSDAEGAAA